MTKGPSFGTPRGIFTYLLTLSVRTTQIGVFLEYFSFSHFLGHFLLLLEIKIKFH